MSMEYYMEIQFLAIQLKNRTFLRNNQTTNARVKELFRPLRAISVLFLIILSY